MGAVKLSQAIIKEAADQARLQAIGKAGQLWPDNFCEGLDGLLAFLKCVRTQVDDGTVLPLPTDPYIELLATRWYETMESGQDFIVEKSRRLVVSWLMRACELWDAGRARREQYVMDSTYQKSVRQVWRVYFLYQSLKERYPSWRLPKCFPLGSLNATEVRSLKLANGSMFRAANNEAEETLSGQGAYRITMEEFGRYRSPGATYQQAKLLLQGPGGQKGGHLVIVTNASVNEEWKAIKARA